MINLLKKPSTLIAYFLLLPGGLAILLMLVVEHNQAQKLLSDNQLLMRDIVVKTMQSNVSDSVNEYPQTQAAIETSWLSLSADFSAYQDNKLIYPFRFRGLQTDTPSTLWQIYAESLENGSVQPSNLSEQSMSRIGALLAIKKHLASSQTDALRHAIERYFLEVENYQLSVLEELISGLSFLQMGTDARWNDALIKQILTQHKVQGTSLFEYLFQQNKQLNSADAKKAIDVITNIIKPTNIDPTWFNQNVNTLWQQPIDIDVPRLPHFAVVNNSWLAIKTNEHLTLLLRFDVTEALTTVEQQLKQQGVLDANDQILPQHSDSMAPSILLRELPFTIDRHQWQEQQHQQQYYFVAKLSVLLVLMASLWVLTTWIAYRHQKRLEYLSLRENFVNLVSHELKTPLASIRIMIETLHKRSQRALSIKDYPEKILTEVDHLWLMVDNLLSLNQLKSDHLTLNIEPTNLQQLIDRVVKKYQEDTIIPITFVNQVSDKAIVFVDPLLFERVIINLVSNAIKYCDKRLVTMSFRFEQQLGHLLFEDNACGIAQSNWSRVFDDFYREQNQLHQQGTGIGLAVCQKIMTLHQAKIKIIASTPDGTTWLMAFRLTQLQRTDE